MMWINFNPQLATDYQVDVCYQSNRMLRINLAIGLEIALA